MGTMPVIRSRGGLFSPRGSLAARVGIQRRITSRPHDFSNGRAPEDVLHPKLILPDQFSWANGDEDQPSTMAALCSPTLAVNGGLWHGVEKLRVVSRFYTRARPETDSQ